MPTAVEILQQRPQYQNEPDLTKKEGWLRKAREWDAAHPQTPPRATPGAPVVQSLGMPGSPETPPMPAPPLPASSQAEGSVRATIEPPDALRDAPGPLKALAGALLGTQRLPWESAPPATTPTTTPEALATEAASQVKAALPGPVQAGVDMAQQLAAPVALGAALTPVGAAINAPVLMSMVASGGGEAINQLLGLSKGGIGEIGVQAALPAVVGPAWRLVRDAGRTLARHIPGAGVAMVEDAVERARGLVTHLRPQELDRMRSAIGARGRDQIPVTNLAATASAIQNEQHALSSGLRSSESMNVAGGLIDAIRVRNQGGQMHFAFEDLRRELQAMGARIGELRRAQGIGATSSTTDYTNLRRLYRSALADIEAHEATVIPAYRPLFRAYRETLRRDFGVQDLAKIFEDNITQRQVDGVTVINARRIREAFERGRDAQFLQESFTKPELKQIRDFMQELLHLPALPTPRGIHAGSMRVLTRLAVGAGLGTAVGGAHGSAIGGGIAVAAPEVLAWLATSHPGRVALRSMIRQTGELSPAFLAGTAALLRTGTKDLGGETLPAASALPPAGAPGAIGAPTTTQGGSTR